MKKSAAIFCIFYSGICIAGDTQREIQHLINYVANSECVFIRNNSRYKSSSAVEHIKKKQRYFKKNITSAEKFIQYAASRSTVSKKPYHIECPNKPLVTSKTWLLDELDRYRKLNLR